MSTVPRPSNGPVNMMTGEEGGVDRYLSSSCSSAFTDIRLQIHHKRRSIRLSLGCFSDQVEVDPRERLCLRDVCMFRVCDVPHLEQDSDPEVQAEIDESAGCKRTVEVRVERVTHPVMPEDIPEPAQEGSVEVTYETLGDLVQRFHDHTQAIPVHRIQTIEGVQREQGHRIVGVESAVMALTERLAELERDKRRLRGTMSVEEPRVDDSRRGKMPKHLICGRVQTREEFEELGCSAKVAEESEMEMEMEEMEMEMEEMEMEEMETEMGIMELKALRIDAGLRKMETDSALTWCWKLYKRTIGVEAAYTMNWVELMKLMTEVYCPRNEIQKMETELWNLAVKGND
ncbi:hypothetical protein Tco_1133373 [Tanacetum coccineum]